MVNRVYSFLYFHRKMTRWSQEIEEHGMMSLCLRDSSLPWFRPLILDQAAPMSTRPKTLIFRPQVSTVASLLTKHSDKLCSRHFHIFFLLIFLLWISTFLVCFLFALIALLHCCATQYPAVYFPAMNNRVVWISALLSFASIFQINIAILTLSQPFYICIINSWHLKKLNNT